MTSADGDDVYRQQETAVTRDYSGGGGGGGRLIGRTAAADERLQQRETAMRDGGDSRLVTMTAAAYGNFRGRRWQRITMALNIDGTRQLAADDDGQGTRPGGEQRWHSALISGNNS